MPPPNYHILETKLYSGKKALHEFELGWDGWPKVVRFHMKEEPRKADINKDFVNLTKTNKQTCSCKFPPWGQKPD